jgi:hypothetical protein
MASASVGLPMISCHCSTGTWLVHQEGLAAAAKLSVISSAYRTPASKVRSKPEAQADDLDPVLAADGATKSTLMGALPRRVALSGMPLGPWLRHTIRRLPWKPPRLEKRP